MKNHEKILSPILKLKFLFNDKNRSQVKVLSSRREIE